MTDTPADPVTTQRRPDRAALCIALVLLALAALLAFDTSRIGGGGGYARIGPATFPYAVAIFLTVLSVWTVFEALRGDFPTREPVEFVPVVWIVGGLAGQMLLLNFAGFAIATGVLFAATARAFGRRPIWLSLAVGIILSGLVWVIFAKALQLRLPAGPLELALAQGFDVVAQAIATAVAQLVGGSR